MLNEQVPTEEMQVKIDKLYRKYRNGLVANIQKGEVPKRIRELARYLAKYVVSPPISVRRIVSYDAQWVTYWYNNHKERQTEDGMLCQRSLKPAPKVRYVQCHRFGIPKKSGIFSLGIKTVFSFFVRG